MNEIDLVHSQKLRGSRDFKFEVIEVQVQVDPVKSFGELKEEVVSSFETQLIKIALGKYSGNLSAAAKALRMDRKHFYDLATKHGIRKKPSEK